MNILLVEPEFPIPNKSKNHSNFLPVGLLKLASFYRKKGNNVVLHRGNEIPQIQPDKILVTSLFTYWADFVKESVSFYKTHCPKSIITVGGIYASLMPEHCKSHTNCDDVFIGQHSEADKLLPAYDLVDVDYQIIHGMRGCTRKCSFCGIWKLEPLYFKTPEEIEKEIIFNKVVFYDNNFFANPNIEDVLISLANYKFNNKVVKFDCQSGFDGRILEEKPHLAKLLKAARFSTVRVAWDFSINKHKQVENWINIIKDAGYSKRNIFVFMIYNWNIDADEIEQKRKKCFDWDVQISDCRYRPLDQTFDNYNSFRQDQTNDDYFIHENWTDSKVKEFRAAVRRHNICIRYNIPWENYERKLESLNARKLKKSG